VPSGQDTPIRHTAYMDVSSSGTIPRGRSRGTLPVIAAVTD
jgi:hypothetical protein